MSSDKPASATAAVMVSGGGLTGWCLTPLPAGVNPIRLETRPAHSPTGPRGCLCPKEWRAQALAATGNTGPPAEGLADSAGIRRPTHRAAPSIHHPGRSLSTASRAPSTAPTVAAGALRVLFPAPCVPRQPPWPVGAALTCLNPLPREFWQALSRGLLQKTGCGQILRGHLLWGCEIPPPMPARSCDRWPPAPRAERSRPPQKPVRPVVRAGWCGFLGE